MNWNIEFAPLLPSHYFIVIAGIIIILTLYMLWQKMRGAALRLLAGLLIIAALANPSILQEEREASKTVVALIIDDSESQGLAERREQTDVVRQALLKRLEKFDDFEIRETVVKNQYKDEQSEGSTVLFKALRETFQDVPPERIGGAIFLTDGRVHDVPLDGKSLSFDAPLHALISGRDDELDRRIEILNAPRFGIINTHQSIKFKVLDHGSDSGEEIAEIEIFIDGEFLGRENIAIGVENTVEFKVPHAGKNIIELKVSGLDGEITKVNNQVFWVMDGIRENLRVLLVSGEPHSGERAWRNLLKSDASVDLVHFTILRPPEKQDGTPINQLSLIAFPTRELFVEKIDQFDLIVFDRYKRRGVLPVLYFDNIARYVENGGAVLVASGPEYSDQSSIHNTPLSRILPAGPNGNVLEKPYRPKISELGEKHPVTRSLNGKTVNDEIWGHWFRQVDNSGVTGKVLMQGADEKPLLILDRPGDGRIAVLLSDHVWLWARGFDGGGPHVQMLRRLSHWLMKEPELEEEALNASVSSTANGNSLLIERQTMSDNPQTVQIIDPLDKATSVVLEKIRPGMWQGSLDVETLGLYQLASDELRSFIHVGPVNPLEYQNVISTKEILAPLFEEKTGYLDRMNFDNPSRIPRIIPISNARVTSGNDWLGLKPTNVTVLKGVRQFPIFAGLLGLLLLLIAMSGLWWREGR